MPKPRNNPVERIFSFISEVGSLMFMKRTHYRSLINAFDTVSSHSHHVAIIAYCITRMEGLSHEDGLKALAMGVLHDNAESRVGDLDFIAKHYDTRNEEKAFNDQLSGLPFEKDLKSLITEYEERESIVSKCVKDADLIEQIYQEWVLTHTGNTMAKRWFDGSDKHRMPFLRTKSAKKLFKYFKTHHPHQWWFEDLVEGDIQQEYLTGKK